MIQGVLGFLNVGAATSETHFRDQDTRWNPNVGFARTGARWKQLE